MNLKKLFNMQRELDAKILLNNQISGQDFMDQNVLALLVELGECANEWRGFKYWSKDRAPRTKSIFSYYKREPVYRNPLLEEYVDCLHLLLSIGNDHGSSPEVDYTPEWEPERFITEAFVDLMRIEWEEPEAWAIGFSRFIGLGKALGFTLDEIEQAYIVKNQINHERQETGY